MRRSAPGLPRGRARSALAFALLSLLPAVTLAARVIPEAAPLTLRTWIEPTSAQTRASGERSSQPVAAGDALRYVIEVRHAGDGGRMAAGSVVLVNPVPPDVVYVPGSAGGAGGRTHVSVDGGRSWRRGAGAAADGAAVTHLRWTLQAAPRPGEAARVHFRATYR